MAGTWFRITLSKAEVADGHVGRIQDAFEELLDDPHAPSGAAMFGLALSDDSEILYFTPSAAELAEKLLKANGGVACEPPVNEGKMVLLVGTEGDERLLNS